jgi:hypothetical protein
MVQHNCGEIPVVVVAAREFNLKIGYEDWAA